MLSSGSLCLNHEAGSEDATLSSGLFADDMVLMSCSSGHSSFLRCECVGVGLGAVECVRAIGLPLQYLFDEYRNALAASRSYNGLRGKCMRVVNNEEAYSLLLYR